MSDARLSPLNPTYDTTYPDVGRIQAEGRVRQIQRWKLSQLRFPE